MHARGKKAPRCTRGSATCNYAYCGSSSFSLPVHVRFTLYPVHRWTKRTLVHDHLRPPREDPPASRATRDLYRCRRSSFLTNDTGEQQGYAIRGICLDTPLRNTICSLAREGIENRLRRSFKQPSHRDNSPGLEDLYTRLLQLRDCSLSPRRGRKAGAPNRPRPGRQRSTTGG